MIEVFYWKSSWSEDNEELKTCNLKRSTKHEEHFEGVWDNNSLILLIRMSR